MQVKINDLENIISVTENFVKKEVSGFDSGHNWFHINRVRNIALYLQEKEGGDRLIIELAALVHDVGDAKFYNNDETVAEKKITAFFNEQGFDSKSLNHILEIVKSLSYKGGNNKQSIDTIEFRIVQDADRLDAMGAIGIARAFNYGGHKQREIYDPEVKPKTYNSSEAYRKSTAPTINHFYEKLLLLKDLINTKTAKDLALKRHNFMNSFLDEFYQEWNLGEFK